MSIKNLCNTSKVSVIFIVNEVEPGVNVTSVMNRALCGLTVERVPRVIHIHRGNSLVQHIPVMIVATSSRLLFTNLTNLTKLESNDPSRNWVVNPPDSTTGQSPELPVLSTDAFLIIIPKTEIWPGFALLGTVSEPNTFD